MCAAYAVSSESFQLWLSVALDTMRVGRRVDLAWFRHSNNLSEGPKKAAAQARGDANCLCFQLGFLRSAKKPTWTRLYQRHGRMGCVICRGGGVEPELQVLFALAYHALKPQPQPHTALPASSNRTLQRPTIPCTSASERASLRRALRS